jgi:ABC-type multidrug transport system fused ATPase/permease subunit
MKIVYKIINLLNYKDRKKLYILFVLSMATAMVDVLGVASIMPFVAIISNQELLITNKILKTIADYIGLNGSDFILAIACFTFIIFAASIAIKVITAYVALKFSLSQEYNLGKKLLTYYIYNDYNWFILNNSAAVVRIMSTDLLSVINYSIIPLVNLFTYSLITISIVTFLLYVNLFMTLSVVLVFGLTYGILFFIVNKKLKKNGQKISQLNEFKIKTINEIFHAFKEIKIYSLEEKFRSDYLSKIKECVDLQVKSQVTIQLPRYILELLAFGLMLVISIYEIYSNADFAEFVPILAMYALASYRLMPAMQHIYGSISALKFGEAALNVWNAEFEKYKNSKKITDKTKIKSNEFKNIELSDIKYSYPETNFNAIENLNLKISKGQLIGFTGKSGSGKTTLINIILGLISQIEGKIKINNLTYSCTESFNSIINVGYVPQEIFLFDGSVADNVSFKDEKNPKNIDNIIKSLDMVGMLEYVQNLPGGLNAKIGERGVKLSGGQRQRIGFARALYRNPDVLVLDEATSALDNLSEDLILKMLEKLSGKVTVIMVAHRMDTIRKCDLIYFMDNGCVKAQGTFHQLIENSMEFKEMVEIGFK